MDIYAWSLIFASFLGALMAGFLFGFAVVVMPGIKKLGAQDFLRSFQAIDKVIQAGQPLFMLMWLGSSFMLIVTAALAVVSQEGVAAAVSITAAVASILLVQLPTMTINIPLNNRVQLLDCETLDDREAQQARESFETPWNRWNNVRTVVSCLILVALLWLLWRL